MRLSASLFFASLSAACGAAAPHPEPVSAPIAPAALPEATAPTVSAQPAPSPGSPASPAELDRAVRWLSGRFDSATQAAADPEFKAVHLAACPIRVEGLGPHVVYVEQALAEQLDRPYRQRLYVVRQEGGRVLSEVLGLTDPKASVGRCDRPDLAPLTAAGTEPKAGCVVELSWDGVAFTGVTQGLGCPSTHRGAVRTTTEVRITATGLETLDRGWDAAGQQAWGSTRGAYRFVRRGEPAAP